MRILVLGATGATGILLVKKLLQHGHIVKAIVRSVGKIPQDFREQDKLILHQGTAFEMNQEALVDFIKDCDAVASCLGHNISFKGMYGHPRKLVSDSIRKICEAINSVQVMQPIKLVLMNTAGNQNRDLSEPISFGQRIVVGLIRMLVPPHVDNEQASDYLRTKVGKDNSKIEWVVVRPDTLINDDAPSEYDIFASPTRSAIFNAGKTSRVNVGHFMAELMINSEVWNQWKGQMPVIYNQEHHD